MRIETIRISQTVISGDGHAVVHDYRRFNGGSDQPPIEMSSLYLTGTEDNTATLMATLRQGLIFETAYLNSIYRDRLFNFGGRDLLTAEDVAVFWAEGKGCHVMRCLEVNSQNAEGEFMDDGTPKKISGYQLFDFSPANEGEHRDRNRLRELHDSRTFEGPCPLSPA